MTGLGERFGASLINGNAILDDLNPQLPTLRSDIAQLSALGYTYADAAPELWDAPDHAVTTARTLDRQQGDLDAALLAAGWAIAGPMCSLGTDRIWPVGRPISLPPASCSSSTSPRSTAL